MMSEKVLDNNRKDNILTTIFLHLFLIYILNRNESCKAIHDEFLL
jgi:hypothetical protein